jgi:transcriptional regulator with XRE-family HTH domain
MDNLVNVYAHTNPQILGRRLTNARKAAGVTQDEAAKILGVARSTLVNIEQGTRLPKADELFRLAERYGAALHTLLRKEPPPEPLQVQFRAAPRIGANLDSKVEQRVEELQQLCDDYFELERLCNRTVPATNAPIYSVEGIPVARAGEDIAQTERNRLGLGDAPLLNVLEVVENEGVTVFQMKLPSNSKIEYEVQGGDGIVAMTDHGFRLIKGKSPVIVWRNFQIVPKQFAVQ